MSNIKPKVMARWLIRLKAVAPTADDLSWMDMVERGEPAPLNLSSDCHMCLVAHVPTLSYTRKYIKAMCITFDLKRLYFAAFVFHVILTQCCGWDMPSVTGLCSSARLCHFIIVIMPLVIIKHWRTCIRKYID